MDVSIGSGGVTLPLAELGYGAPRVLPFPAGGAAAEKSGASAKLWRQRLSARRIPKRPGARVAGDERTDGNPSHRRASCVQQRDAQAGRMTKAPGKADFLQFRRLFCSVLPWLFLLSRTLFRLEFYFQNVLYYVLLEKEICRKAKYLGAFLLLFLWVEYLHRSNFLSL